ncbi:MAG TPA: glycosyltransferase family 39 protein [Blastocatellia bacterium]|nr:glycosyltransferase family 39 protein [Blastocatellia bacterium]
MPSGRVARVRDWLSKNLKPLEPDHAEPQLQSASPTKSMSLRARLLIVCAAIFFISSAVRLLYFQDMRAEVLHTESLATTMIDKYEEEKQRMFNDGGLLFPSKTVDPSDARMLFHPPGHSILLAAIYGKSTPDRHYTSLRLLHIFCGALSSVFIVLIAAQLLPLAVASIAGLLASLSPQLAYHALWLTPDSLCILPILVGVYLVLKARKRPRLLTVISAGAMFGLSVWLRTNALLLAPVIALVIVAVFDNGKRFRYAAAFVCAAAVVIAPITIRNWVVYHRFVPVTLGSGLLLVEGIAEYDKEGKFGMAAYDGQVCMLDAEWHGRPDYAQNPWFPDGIERDRARFGRGLQVMRSNPVWSIGMMTRRMAFMVRYNDFRPTPLPFRISRAPSVSWTPPFGHDGRATVEGQPLFSAAPQELMSDRIESAKITASIQDGGQELLVSGRGVSKEEMFVSTPVPMKSHTDYILRVSASLERGEAVVQARSDDLRLSLGEKALARIAEADAQPIPSIDLPFASGDQTLARVVISGNSQESTRTSLRLGRVELIELGPTPYQWTRPARAVTRAFQQNVFKTDYVRLLIVGGIVLLALARMRRALIVLLAAPVYYLITHSPFGIDYRYALPMHYFLFVIAAVTFYCAGKSLAPLGRRLKRSENG